MTTEDGRITVQRTINASTEALFDILSNPHRHAELDGSGFVRSLDRGDRIAKTGQHFRMNMSGDHMGGEYQTDNTVTGYDHNHLLSWKPGQVGEEPPGWEWTWELQSEGPESTLVTLTYDWSRVTDKQTLRQIKFPLVKEHQLEESLAKLAEAAAG